MVLISLPSSSIEDAVRQGVFRCMTDKHWHEARFNRLRQKNEGGFYQPVG